MELVTTGAVVTAVVWALLHVLVWNNQPLPRSLDAPRYVLVALATDYAFTVAEILTVIAWVLLYTIAVQARLTGWLFALVVAVILTLVVPPLLPSTLDGVLTWPLLGLGPVVAFICVRLLPTDAASGMEAPVSPTA